MSSKPVHFEVFIKNHRKDDWTLFEARDDREEALEIARTLLKRNPSASVRVTREQYDTNERIYRTVPIFEGGAERFQDPKEKTGEATLPCVTPADLLGPAARDTMRRVLSGWFERKQVCPLELMNRADLADDLDGSDTDLQHAIQKVAISRAQNSDASVHAYVRLLNELTERAMNQVRAEAAARARVAPKDDDFAAAAARILAEGTPEKRLQATIAEKLKNADTIGRKAVMLLDLMDTLPADPDTRMFAGGQADLFLSEILSFDRALEHVIGKCRDAGDHVERLTALYEGVADHPNLMAAPEAARRLATRIGRQDAERTRSEIARRILTLLRSPKRLKPDSVLEEIKLARALAQRLIAASGPDLAPQALVEAFTHRSARLLAPETIDEALEGAGDATTQIERLLAMEDNLVGAANKNKLAGYVRNRLNSQGSQSWFIRGPGQPFERLARLAALQRRCDAGTFDAKDKAELSAAFDAMGLAVLEETRVFDRITKSGRPVLDQAAALLKLSVQGLLPSGRCTAQAQDLAGQLLGSEDGRTEAADPGAAPTLAALQSLLAQAAVGEGAPPKPASGGDDTANKAA